MEEARFDILAPKEDQLRILIPYLEAVAEGEERSLPATTRTRVLINRYLWNWRGFCTIEGLTPKGALLYYKKLKEQK